MGIDRTTLTLRLSAVSNRNPIFDAIIRRNRPVLLFLITSDSSCIEAVDSSSGLTPLMCAVTQDDKTSVKILLDYGAEINARNQYSGCTALMYAVYHHHLTIVKVSSVGALIRYARECSLATAVLAGSRS